MLNRTKYLALLLFVFTTAIYGQDADYDGIPDFDIFLNPVDLCPNIVDPLNLDTDGDGIGDVCDVDDDNDGILDSNDCEVTIPNFSFENGLTNWTVESSDGVVNNSVLISPANDGPFPGAEGANYLDIEAYAETIILTTSNAFAVYRETSYIFEIALADLPFPIGSTVPAGFYNDGNIRLELGYGDNNANYTPIPGAFLDINGPTETVEGWNEFSIPFQINAGDAAEGEGVLIRISHTGIGGSAVGLGVDFVRLSIDSDHDGISNCKEVDSDNDGCFDVVEAGHTDGGGGLLAGTLSISGDGSIDNATEGYTGNTQAVFDAGLISCNIVDFDLDGVLDINDLDDDNDGILDIYDCEIPVLNYSFESSTPGDTVHEGWEITSTSSEGANVAIPNSLDDYFYAPEGNQYGFINGDGIISQRQSSASFELGAYILSLDIGDGIGNFNNNYRNDGTSIVEIGYLDAGNNFVLVNSLTVTSDQTPNGIWKRFSFSTQINPGDPALGEGIRIRIMHEQNAILNQRRGDYDNITLLRDRDNDGNADCIDYDSDGDGCPDVTEVGHIDNGSSQLQGTGINPTNGLVIGYNVGSATGYTGLRAAYFDNSINPCNIIDTDGDGLADGDRYYFLANGDTAWDGLDLDNDNDGILDTNEGCELTLTSSIYSEEFANFDQPNNFFFAGGLFDEPYSSGVRADGVTGILDFWIPSNPNGAGPHMVNAGSYIDLGTGQPYSQNYFTDGTLQPDNPDPNNLTPSAYENDSFAFIDGDGILTQTRSDIFMEESSYIITIAVGDGLDYENGYRNDGVSLIEAGYGPVASFTSLNQITVNPEDTPNGTWTDFTFNITVPAGSPAIGQELLLRITHTENIIDNQLAGNYDHIRISRDTDGDGISDCLDDDSDGDGCPDATEAGFENDDFNAYVGLGIPTIAGGNVNAVNGLVTGTDGYNPPVNGGIFVITPAAPVLLGPLGDETSCEGGNVTFSATATRTVGLIIYEWYESTDGGTTFNLVTEVAPFSGTSTSDLMITAVTVAQNNNQYRVRVFGDDYLCFEEETATLTVTAGPTSITPVAVVANICEGEDAEFTITGTTGDIINYSLDGGTPISVTLDATGIETITSAAVTADVTMEISSIESGTCTLNLVPATSATITINTIPALDPTTTATCVADLSSYDVDVVLNIGNITAVSEGLITGNTVTGIIAGNDLVITVDNNGCIRNLTVTAPDCSCPIIDLPINANNPSICFGALTPDVSVDLGTNGDAINWYDASTAGTLLGNGITYTTGETAVGTYTYYAEAIETASGCTSNRIPVTLVINPMPVADTSLNINECAVYELPLLSAGSLYYTGTNGTGTNLLEGSDITTTQTIYIYAESGTTPNCFDENSFIVNISDTPQLNLIAATCSADLNTYSVQFSNNIPTAILSTTAGTISGNTVIDIPSNITSITVTADNNGCAATLAVIAPDCSCPIIDDATNPINAATCEGAPNTNLQVSLGASGDTINWFNAATGGTSIANGLTFTPNVSAVGIYTYYAEASDNITGCISDNRIPVTLTIEEIPVANTLNDVEGCEFYLLPNLSANNSYYTGANGTGQLLAEGSQVNQSQTIYIYAQSPNNQDCSSESEFEVSILEEPIIDLPYEVSICSNANGVTTSVPIGVDLGAGYIYDWTPNNDTNNDGIEEAIFNVSQAGEYSLRIYTVGNTINCGGSLEYVVHVTDTDLPQNIEVNITAEGYELNSGNRVRAIVNNDIFAYTNFEFSLDDPDGPYQADNFFQNVVGGLHTIFVRSIGSCGTTLESDPFLIVNYPTYFSPNGDGSNDTWFPLGLADPNLTTNVVAEIYDRHGKLIHYLDIFGSGWDGTYNGVSLPESDYWFVIEYTDAVNDNRNIQFKGHFSLIR